MLHGSHLVLRLNGRPIIRGVTLALSPGEIVGLVAQSGGGKSALLALLAGAIAPTAGAVWLEGVALPLVPAAQRARRLACWEQGSAAVGSLSASAWIAGQLGDDAVGSRSIAEAALAWVGLGPQARAPLAALAHGARRLVALAATLARVWENGGGAGAVVLLDDPFAGLDARQRRQVAALIPRLAATGTAVLLALPEPAHAADLCHRIVWLRAGALIGESRPGDGQQAALAARALGPAAHVAAMPLRRGLTPLSPFLPEARLLRALAARPPANDPGPPQPPAGAA